MSGPPPQRAVVKARANAAVAVVVDAAFAAVGVMTGVVKDVNVHASATVKVMMTAAVNVVIRASRGRGHRQRGGDHTRLWLKLSRQDSFGTPVGVRLSAEFPVLVK